jgi:hypothetical protein
MPHSSSGFGEIRVNRMYLVEKELAKEDREGKVQLSGQESSPPTTIPMIAFLHEQVTSLQKGVVIPVTFRDKAELDGYYTVETASSELTDHQSEISKSSWTIELNKCGTHTEIDLQSRLTGAVRANDFSQSGERWHAPAINHYSYFTGATDISSTVNRTSADGTIVVYRGIPTGVHPRWGCTPTNYLLGRVRLTDTLLVSSENEVEGCCHRLSTTGWSLSNGLVNVAPTASAGVIDVQSYSGGAYRSNLIRIQRNGVDVQTWQSVSIIRNTAEQVIIRLTANIVSAPGRVTLDLNLRRGSRFVEGYLQSSSSTTLKVVCATTTASTAGTGYVVKTSNDANGNRMIIGSARSHTADTTTGGISKASVTALDFYIGAVISATSPASGDAAADLQAQYIGTLPESTYYVKR